MRKAELFKNPIFTLVAGLALFAACTTEPLQLQDVDQPERYDALAYYNWTTLASPDALLHEMAQREADIDHTSDDESLVQLAVLISARASDRQQELRAIHLLDEFDSRTRNKTVDQDYQIFSGLWRQTLKPRLLSHSLEERVALLEHENASLREQIEALMSIEQQLDQREQVRERSRNIRAL